MRAQFLPYCLPWIGEEEIQEVVDSLRSGWLTTGPKVKRFEDEFAAYVGARHAIAVSSCTAALHLPLAACGIGRGDEVIVPTLTFCATANVVLHLGARPVLVDVDEQGLMNPYCVEKAITKAAKAIVPVHFAGQSCDLDALLSIASSRGLALIEDAAHAAGATYLGKKIGVHGYATAFSFYATKNMTTGEGGMITTSDDGIAVRLRRLALHGMSRNAWKRYSEEGSWYYEVLEPGYKNNMTDLQASLGLPQLRRLPGFVERRREIARRYDRAFADIDEIETPLALPDRGHVYHLYAVRLRTERLTTNRAGFLSALAARRIGGSVHFIPLHRHPYYRETFGYRPEQFPVAEKLYEGYASLPLYPRMTDADVEDVIEAVREIVAQYRKRVYAAPVVRTRGAALRKDLA
ncbi:MAG TPA: DegT/DnrJ/EryC1/StrS aminotransferase family protein [Bryobacteraceae bacterium]|nr:DegT/DnrJ/EryC1/StrS aminotransferase family protein [Bryobacteraceae bacterium]